MGDLRKNFSRSEFICHGTDCCDHTSIATNRLLNALQELRDLVDVPLSIVSGFRCNRHNRQISGAVKSFHILGMAADIQYPELVGTNNFINAVKEIKAFYDGGIGIYRTYIHVDVRTNGKARWKHPNAV